MRVDRLSRRDRPALQLRICTGPLERAKGLLFEPELPPATALYFEPCRAVHTFGMRHAIDVAFIDDRGLVLTTVEACPPWRVLHEPRAASVLELRAGECARIQLRAGERLALPRAAAGEKRADTAQPPSAVSFHGLLTVVLLLVAVTWLAGCTAAPPRRADAERLEELALQASLEYASRNWQAAQTAYAELVTSNPENAEYRYRLGLALLRAGRIDEAAATLEAARTMADAPLGSERALAVARLAQARDALAAARERERAYAERTGATRDTAASGAVPSSTDRVLDGIEQLLPRDLARASAGPQ